MKKVSPVFSHIDSRIACPYFNQNLFLFKCTVLPFHWIQVIAKLIGDSYSTLTKKNFTILPFNAHCLPAMN